MTDDQIIDMAKRLGWNVEHAQTNRMLILFTRAVAVELIGQQNKALLDSALLSSDPGGLKTREQDMTLREAAQQALEVLDQLQEEEISTGVIWTPELLESLRAALAEPEQEPVAWMHPSGEGYDSAFRDHSTVMACDGNKWEGWIPLYTHPPQRKPLSDEQIFDLIPSPGVRGPIDALWFARAIERAHGIGEKA